MPKLCLSICTFQNNVLDTYAKIQEMPLVPAFLLGTANSRLTLINSILEEVLAILEEKKEMADPEGCATLLVLVRTLSADSSSKASR